VRFTGDWLEVLVPAAPVEEWAGGNIVGIDGDSGSLDILVEKDFRPTSASSPNDDERYPMERQGIHSPLQSRPEPLQPQLVGPHRHELPQGYRVASTPVLHGLHREYRLEQEAA
jgi:hypothetical protein